jgi:hypothetical protein
MDALRAGAAWLATQLKSSAATNVIYRRGQAWQVIAATIGQTTFESADQNGVVEQWQSRDFIIAAADFPHAEPLRGDRIVEMVNGAAVVFEAAAPRGVPLFRYGDAWHSTIRVHAKRVGVDATVTSIGQG